jgi:hypothetical protein
MQASTLRPGLLVSLKTSIRGNVSYDHRDIERDHLTEDGSQLARWETERVISDPAEYEAATKVRSKVRSIISSVCATSAFGLLCPENAFDQLDAAIIEARKLADDFNADAKLTRVRFNVMAGRIASDDVEAVRAINGEVRDLLADMAEGIRNLDVKAVRDAADQARNIGRMLNPDAQARIQEAIDAARSTARQIVKAGDQVAQEIDQLTIRRITEARTAFLDLEPVAEVAVPAAEGRAVDFEPAPEIKSMSAPTIRVALELE